MKNRMALFGVMVLILVLGIGALVTTWKPKTRTVGKLQIVTTLFPWYDFARSLVGNDGTVTLLLPPGVDAHSFEPSPRDIQTIEQADVLMYSGNTMEPWLKGLLSSLASQQLTVVDASAGIQLIGAVFHDPDEPVGTLDPHFWLDFGNDQLVIDHLQQILSERDPTHQQDYLSRAKQLKQQLTALDLQYQQTFSSCPNKTLVYGGHYALGYLAKRYGLQYRAAQGVAPDAEPSAQDLVNLVDDIKANHVLTVYDEALSSPKIAQTLANETQAKLLAINPAHNVSKADLDSGVTFVEIMEHNLHQLVEGQPCPTL